MGALRDIAMMGMRKGKGDESGARGDALGAIGKLRKKRTTGDSDSPVVSNAYGIDDSAADPNLRRKRQSAKRY